MREADTLSFTRQLVWHSPSLPQRPLSLIRISFLVLESVPHPHLSPSLAVLRKRLPERRIIEVKGLVGQATSGMRHFVLARWQQSYISCWTCAFSCTPPAISWRLCTYR